MGTQLQLRGGTTVESATFTGASREVTVNTTKKTLLVHDGSTPGGHELARADLSNVSIDLADINHVSISSPTSGQVLKYNGTNWINDTDATGGGGSSSLGTLTDVALTSPTSGQVLKYNGTNWVNGTDATGSSGIALSDLSVTDLGGDGSLSYNNTTGVFTYTGPSATEVRAHFSAGTGINIASGVISTTITQYTNSDADARIAAASIDALSDVVLTSPSNGQVLKFDSGSNKWVNAADATGAGGTGISLSDLSASDLGGDGSFSYNNTTGVFSYTGPSATEVRAHFSAGTGINIASGVISSTITQYTNSDADARIAAASIDALNDVVITTPSNGQVIKFNGTNWVNSTDSTGISLTSLSATTASGVGSLSYNNTTGVFTYTGPSSTEIRSQFSAGTGINIASGVISSTITQYTNSDADARIAAASIDALNDVTITTPSNGQVLKYNGSAWVNSTDATGSGTVTSVSWTGGIVSIANSTTTPAFTIAGTSGGIPYFSTTSSWATSALLTANAIMVGGGAGQPPATVSTGTGVITAISNNVNTAGGLITSAVTSLGSLATVGTLTSGTWNAATVGVGYGGTGQTTYTDGQLLIGNSTGNTLTKATLTSGTGITVTNGSGAITITNSSPMTYPGAGISVSTGSAWGTSLTAPSGTIVGTSDSQILTNKTLTNPAINGFTGDTSAINIGSGQIYKDTSGNVGIGTTSPNRKLEVRINSASNTTGQSRVSSDTGYMDLVAFGSTATAYGAWAAGNSGLYTTVSDLVLMADSVTSNIRFASGGNTERMRIDTSGKVGINTTSPSAMLQVLGTSSTAALKINNILETATVSATAATGTINYDVTTQSVLYYTTNASANWTLNIRASSGTSLNTMMAVGDVITIVHMVTQGATPYYNNVVQIDGSTVTPKYQGGTAWSSGNASGIDIYTYTVIKTASATFTVLASQTQFK